MNVSQQVGAVAGAVIGALASAAVVGATYRNADKRKQYVAIAALVGAVGGGAIGYEIAPQPQGVQPMMGDADWSNSKAQNEGVPEASNSNDSNGFAF
jgi:uncharacterized protein YcfJ